MPSILPIGFNVNNVEAFLHSIADTAANTTIYLIYGKVSSWDNVAVPPQANGSVDNFCEIWNNAIGAKKLTFADTTAAVPRFNWTSNTRYNYSDTAARDQFNIARPFYVVNRNYDVYKCLANANGAVSTVEPTVISISSDLTTSDGYTWKYMYTISDNGQLRFLTDDFMPVKTLDVDDGSTQWGVQNNAIMGAIHALTLVNPGAGYTNVANLTITITGDGADATATANINLISQTVSTLVITNLGMEYTYADVTIAGGGGSGASARALLSPPSGHGSDPLYELGGRYIILNPRLKGTEGGVFPATNDFRQIALLKNPLLLGSTDVAANSAILQAMQVTLIGTGDYIEDEYVYQGPNLAGSSFSARVLAWDSGNGRVTLINTLGTISSDSMTGANSATIRFVSSTSPGALEPCTGEGIYIDNFSPINRNVDQTEDFKIVLTF